MRPVRATCSFILSLVAIGCTAAPHPGTTTPAPAPTRAPSLTILHINDVYEIAPLDGGRSGGLARVATLLERERKANPNTILTLGGDFYSPSAIGTAQVDGQRLGGRQMVAVLNAVGLDAATFGNHEFDLTEPEFRARIAESRFRYVVSNVTDAAGIPFTGTVPHSILTLTPTKNGDRPIRVGIIGAVIPSNRRDWVRYDDALSSLRREVTAIRDSVDAIIALTHLSLATDQEIVEAIPKITLVIGGHEHENWAIRRGARFAPILKADANARSVVRAAITFPPGAPPVVTDDLTIVTDSIAEDSAVAREVTRWTALAHAGFRALGFDPVRVVARTTIALDGRETTTRNRPAPLTLLLADALRREQGAEIGLINTGSVRIDDVLPAGAITEYDVLRILPFGGKVVRVEMTGELLNRVLQQSEANRGTGGYLVMTGAGAIDPARWYRVATTDFLVSGLERGLDFLAPGNPGLTISVEGRDIRLAVIDELQRRFAP